MTWNTSRFILRILRSPEKTGLVFPLVVDWGCSHLGPQGSWRIEADGSMAGCAAISPGAVSAALQFPFRWLLSTAWASPSLVAEFWGMGSEGKSCWKKKVCNWPNPWKTWAQKSQMHFLHIQLVRALRGQLQGRGSSWCEKQLVLTRRGASEGTSMESSQLRNLLVIPFSVTCLPSYLGSLWLLLRFYLLSLISTALWNLEI